MRAKLGGIRSEVAMRVAVVSQRNPDIIPQRSARNQPNYNRKSKDSSRSSHICCCCCNENDRTNVCKYFHIKDESNAIKTNWLYIYTHENMKT